jgi:hypothetical protein
VLGGIACGLVAPLVFSRVVEYPLLIVAALACHQGADEEQAEMEREPAPQPDADDEARERERGAPDLEVYVCVSLGGVLGGIACGLVAPLVFSRVVEYPLLSASSPPAGPPPRGRGAAAGPTRRGPARPAP